jgi:hypothetical protein
MVKKEKVTGRKFLINKQNQNIENQIIDNSNEGRITTEDLIARSEDDVPVGAFAVPGIQGGTNDEDEPGSENVVLSRMHSIQNPIVTITNARLVRSDIIDATLLESSQVDNNNVKSYKKGSIRRYMLVIILSLVVIVKEDLKLIPRLRLQAVTF